MWNKRNTVSMLLGIAIGSCGVAFLGAPAARFGAAMAAEEKTMTNADYARGAMDDLKKAHQDIDHLVTAGDKKAKGYGDAEQAKKDTDHAIHALQRYVDTIDHSAKK